MREMKELAKLIKSGEIDRREFLHRVSTLGAAGSLSALFAQRAVFASTPKKGGRLRDRHRRYLDDGKPRPSKGADGLRYSAHGGAAAQ